MQNRCCYLGVDIGNSGLRVAKLDTVNHALHSLLRVAWRFDEHTAAVVKPGHNAPSTELPRYLPDSTDWLVEVEQFIHSVAENLRLVWLVSSVRRDASSRLKQFVDGRPDDQWHAITRHDLPLDVHVLQPDRVGIDRLLAASAAASLFQERPLIVMQVGSAMTVDLVANPNRFEGGAILPGVPMMLRLLGQAADLLPSIDAAEIIELPALPGRDTEQAMRCGTASALVGGGQHLVARYRSIFGPNTLVVISGGDGMKLSQHIEPPTKVVPQLVLQGLIPVALQK